jgi:hypothetical protein
MSSSIKLLDNIFCWHLHHNDCSDMILLFFARKGESFSPKSGWQSIPPRSRLSVYARGDTRPYSPALLSKHNKHAPHLPSVFFLNVSIMTPVLSISASAITRRFYGKLQNGNNASIRAFQ